MITAEHIGAALARATTRLDGHAPAPEREAEILLAAAAGLPRTTLLAFPERALTDDAVSRYEGWVERRRRGEPIAYITGTREFWSLALRVGPGALIPRPETEHLVAIALEDCPHGATVLDLGTGSGAVAIALAHERSDLQVTATDISEDALAIAAANVARYAEGRVRLLRGAWFDPVSEERFDVIVSNPPYIGEHEPELERGDVRFEPRRALVAGAAGMDDLVRIVSAAPDHLRGGGRLLLEHGWRQGPAVRRLCRARGLVGVETRRDLAGHERVTLGYAGGRQSVDR